MKILLSAQAANDLKKIPKIEGKKIVRKLQSLGDVPTLGKKLKGDFFGLRSIKAWPYRIIYRLYSDSTAIEIVTIEHRQGVYK